MARMEWVSGPRNTGVARKRRAGGKSPTRHPCHPPFGETKIFTPATSRASNWAPISAHSPTFLHGVDSLMKNRENIEVSNQRKTMTVPQFAVVGVALTTACLFNESPILLALISMTAAFWMQSTWGRPIHYRLLPMVLPLLAIFWVPTDFELWLFLPVFCVVLAVTAFRRW